MVLVYNAVAWLKSKRAPGGEVMGDGKDQKAASGPLEDRASVFETQISGMKPFYDPNAENR
jgi:hypothetical protein